MGSPTVETDTETRLEITEENNRQAAAEILVSYSLAEELRAKTSDFALQAIEEAYRCGAMLNAQKEKVGHGNWMNWCKTFLPQTSQTSRERCMQLAKSDHGQIFSSNPKSLRQAYIAVGILPDPVTSQHTRLNGQSKPLKPTSSNSSLLTIINEFRAQKPIESIVQTADFASWDEVELETVIRLLAPITEARSRMIHALSQKLRQ